MNVCWATILQAQIMQGVKGSPISVGGQEAKRSPAASFSFSQKLALFSSESDGARGVVRACHFYFVRMHFAPRPGR
jgi:hypothetical protein